MKRYDEVIQYGSLYRQEDPAPTRLANSLTSLAQARVNGERATVEAWIDNTERQIRSTAGNGELSYTGGINGLDIYEIVLEMLQEMEEAGTQIVGE